MRKKPSIQEISKLGGVSMSTVSLVLNNKPGVSDETRTRVLEAANQLGYPIRPATPQPKSSPLATVGMLVKIDPDTPPHANPFYSKVMAGVEDACRRRAINLLYASLPVDDGNRPVELPQLLSNDVIDGLLLIGASVDDHFGVLTARTSVPIVLVDGYSTNQGYDSIVSDNFHAAYRAVEYLLKLGHRHIGLAGSHENSFPSLQDRRNGYRRALKDRGIQQLFSADFNINKTHGLEETGALLEAHPEITALVCVNDDVASAAIRAAQSLGKRVPEDLSIIGYDDTYIAANTHPALTTMHVDTVAMGRAAVHLLSLRSENPESARMTLTIHPTLVERQSTRENKP